MSLAIIVNFIIKHWKVAVLAFLVGHNSYLGFKIKSLNLTISEKTVQVKTLELKNKELTESIKLESSKVKAVSELYDMSEAKLRAAELQASKPNKLDERIKIIKKETSASSLKNELKSLRDSMELIKNEINN